MKKIGPPGFIFLGFLATGLIFVDLVFRLFFIHAPWSEEPFLLIVAWVLLLAYMVVLTRTVVRLQRAESELRRAGEELQRRVEERTAELEAAHARLLAEVSERQRIEERQRLARELHDSVAQTLYGISLGINTASSYLDTDRAQVAEALDYALKLASSGLVEMRALIFDLRPDALSVEGLVVALTRRVAGMRARYGIEVDLDVCDEPEIDPLAQDALYRIASEALWNAARHAQASRLEVRLACEEGWLTLSVCDNGRGFDPMVAHAGHLGLRSMRERAEGVRGTLEIVSKAGCGTQLRARLPLATGSPQ